MSSETPKFIHVMPEDYPIEGSDCITYVLCEDLEDPDNEAGILLFAGTDCTLQHIQLLWMAKGEELIDEDTEGVGGGHLYSDSLGKMRDSFLMGGVSNQIINSFVDYLENIADY